MRGGQCGEPEPTSARSTPRSSRQPSIADRRDLEPHQARVHFESRISLLKLSCMTRTLVLVECGQNKSVGWVEAGARRTAIRPGVVAGNTPAAARAQHKCAVKRPRPAGVVEWDLSGSRRVRAGVPAMFDAQRCGPHGGGRHILAPPGTETCMTRKHYASALPSGSKRSEVRVGLGLGVFCSGGPTPAWAVGRCVSVGVPGWDFEFEDSDARQSAHFPCPFVCGLSPYPAKPV